MKEAHEVKPPILGTWQTIYLLMAGMLVVLGVLFYLFTKHFE